jgi:hypothetical protein
MNDPMGRTTVNKKAIDPYGAIGFGVASVFAVAQEWSLPEFCWSSWLAGLVYAWGCIVTASLEIILTARSARTSWEKRLPSLGTLPYPLLLAGATCISAAIGLAAFNAYNFLFGFYGLFLSVFAEMSPLSLFGRNGFINSDFYTPAVYLLDRFWPMAAGVLLANGHDLLGKNPWQRVFLPVQREILRLHLMILALPFFAMLAWALVGNSYQSITIVLIMGLFYFLPKPAGKDGGKEKDAADA